MSKLNVLNITFPAETVVNTIFTSILDHRFAPFNDLKIFVGALVKATL